MSIKIFLPEWFHHTPSLIINKWEKAPVHHLSILGIEYGSLGCTTACPTTEPRLSLLKMGENFTSPASAPTKDAYDHFSMSTKINMVLGIF